MNLSSVSPEQAWQMALGQLQLDMPKVYFDTWVRDTVFISFTDGLLTIGTANVYASEWLTSRLTSTVSRLLTGILTQPVSVQFVVHELAHNFEDEPEEEIPVDVPDKGKPPEVLTLQAEYQSIYDEIVQPEQVIVIPGYFLRHIPMLGVELAWLYVGFRQSAYEAGASKKPGKKVSAPAKKVAWYAGISPRSFWRWTARPATWKLLRWLVKPVDETAKWNRGSDGRPHQAIRNYRVAMTMPLTPFDELSLRAFLHRKLSEGNGPLAALRSALETPFDELLPWPEKMPALDEIGGGPLSIKDVMQEVCGPISENEKTQFNELIEKLAQYLIPSSDLIFLTHYFVSHWLPRLGPGPGWFVTLMRDRCYLNRRTGEIRDDVRLDQGYAEAARLLSLKRVKTIWEWLRNAEVAIFLRETGREIGTWEDAPRRFKVCLGEPMTDEDQDRANALLAKSPIGASVTHRDPEEIESIGASGTHREMMDHLAIGASVNHDELNNGNADGASGTHSEVDSDNAVGASVTHRDGNPGPSIGASCNDLNQPVGASDSHKVGASVTLIGASDTYRIGASGTFDWRDWHSLNSLTPGFKRLTNTQTTSSANDGLESENACDDTQKRVAVGEWKIEGLLSLNRISPQKQELLLEKGVTAQTFISWLLYAAGKSGNSIRDPIGHAVSRLAQDPGKGAGGTYDRLAELPADELANLISRELNGQSPWNTDWRTVLESTPRTRLRMLADQLGVPVPDTND
jgi:hypothetical protein